MTPPTVGRVQDRATFRALRRPAGRAAHGPIKVSYAAPLEGAPAFPLVGYAVSRQCGNAVTRNRLRRRLREVARANAHELDPGTYLVRTDPAAALLAYPELAAATSSALRAATRTGRAAGPTTAGPATPGPVER